MGILKFGESLLIICTIFCSVNAQSIAYDVISISQANILGIALGTSETELFSKLGEPDSVRASFDPIVDEDTIKTYYYKQSELVTQLGEVKEIAIKSEAYPLSYQEIKVGNSLDDIKNIFPKSYSHIDGSEGSSRKVMTIFIGDLEKNITYDEEVQLLFVNGTLKQIAIWAPL